MRRFFTILFCVALVAACNGRKTIPKRNLVKILAEMHLADAALEENLAQRNPGRRDSTAVYLPILDEYGYTVEQLYSSIQEHCKTKGDADKLYDKVNKRLGKLQKQYAKEVKALHERQNCWSEKTSWQLPNDGDTSRLDFSIPSRGAGTYILSADVALAAGDSVSNPRMSMYLYAHRCRIDSIVVDSIRRDTTICTDTTFAQVEQSLLREEQERSYSLSITVSDTLATHIRGYLLNHDNDSLAHTRRYATVKNIMLRYVSPDDAAVNTMPSRSPRVKLQKQELKLSHEQ